MTVAGDLRRNRWVVGVAGGQATSEQAEEAAFAACQARRARRRIQAPCQLYASGDEKVWTGQ